jgi:RsiW-degrading membrane proteinase PrsW (M82 family)
MEIESLYKFLGLARQFRLFRSALFIVVVGAGLLILNEYFFRTKFNVWPAIPYSVYWLIIAITFSALMFITWQRYQHESERLRIETFLAGIFLGLAIAIYKVFAYRELWTVFNLLAEPIRTALFGLLVTWVLKEKSRALAVSQIEQ